MEKGPPLNSETVAWFCQNCGRKELPKDMRICPSCGERMQRCSRYEWFLIDELNRLLRLYDRCYRIQPQFPIQDHRGFTWHWDVRVWVEGESYYKGFGLLIEVDGPRHKKQKRYKGPGGGYTRDEDKEWEAFTNYKLHKKGYDTYVVNNEDCSKKNDAVHVTALEILAELLDRADNEC